MHRNKIMLIATITIIINIILAGCIFDNNDERESAKRFTASEGYELAYTEAMEWHSDAFLTIIDSRDARSLDGKCYEWLYNFHSVSTITNSTDGPTPWTIELLQVKITKKGNSYKSYTEVMTSSCGTKNASNLPQKNFDAMDSDTAAELAEQTEDVQYLKNNYDEMWVDYRLTNLGWQVNVDPVQSNAHLEGIAIVVKINPISGNVTSYNNAIGAD